VAVKTCGLKTESLYRLTAFDGGTKEDRKRKTSSLKIKEEKLALAVR